MAAQGKIGRLPHAVRQELCERLLNNQPAEGVILPWINGLPEVQAILAEQFDGQPISPQNLSLFRSGPFSDWMEKQENVLRIQRLTEFASRLGQAANEGLSQGTLALANGKILELLEGSTEDDPELLKLFLKDLPKLSNEEVKHKTLALKKDQLTQRKAETKLKEETLRQAREKLELQTVEKFMEWADSAEAQAILNSKKPQTAKMADLRALMFGRRKNNPNPEA